MYEVCCVYGERHESCIVYGYDRARQVLDNYRENWAIHKRCEFRGGLRLLTDDDELMVFEHNWKREGF